MTNETKITAFTRKKMRLERHYKALEKLALLCDVSNPNGLKISSKLLSLENTANRHATNYCNGDITTERWERISEEIEKQVQALFNNKLKGFFVNGDCRGYSLKIKDEFVRGNGCYSECGLNTDWGGYGLLAPEINGN